MKTVSIVICTYNGEKYLREQLDSVLAQTYPLLEILIQDDCSTDGTWAILEEYQCNFPQLIRIIQNKTNLGWNLNFLNAIQKAKGDYIACCDQDDVWNSKKIEIQMNQIGDNWLHVCSSLIWEGEQLIPFYSFPGTIIDVCINYAYSGHQFLLSRKMLDFVPVGIEADMSHDRFLPVVAIYKQRISVSKDMLVKWRRHENTATKSGIPEKNQSGMGKFWYCISQLLFGRKSKKISRACGKYVKVFGFLDRTDGTYPNSRLYVELMDALGRQTICSYIRAGNCVWKLRHEIIHKSSKGLKQLYSAYSFPFRWWYVHRIDI